MRPSYLLAGCLLVVSAGCSDTPPTQPTPVTETPTTAPTAAFTVTVDTTGSQEAIAGVSNVTVDASASTGAGARFEVAFGDGETATTAVARHVYRNPGSFTVTLTVTDSSGRKTTTTRQLVVTSPLGRWVHSGFINRRGEVQVRTLLLSAQDGLTVRGVLTRDGNRTIPITGTLTAERTIRLVLEDGSEVLEGSIPSVFSTLTTWPLTSRGSSIDGQSIAFTRIAGEVMGAAPDAVLGMRFFSFGAPFAVKQISPVLFDGSKSRGEGLTYFLEFGDGEIATSASATHPMQKEGNYVARLTVVDRFGRSDSESTPFRVYSLVMPGLAWLDYGDSCQCGAYLWPHSQDGSRITGVLRLFGLPGPYVDTPFTGTVTASGEVRLTFPDSDVLLVGTLALPSVRLDDPSNQMTLSFVGGQRHGTSLALHLWGN